MPALASHWNQSNPEGKADIRKLFEEIRDMNAAHKANAAAKSGDDAAE